MNDSNPRLHHEDLDAYQAAISFLALAAKLFDQFPRGYGSIADQFKRAALSVPLNLAEGYGKRGQVDRARFYDIARGSAHECGALLDACKVLSLVDEHAFSEGKLLLHRIVSMLVKMTQ
jgi:four helix bundle protein